MFNNQIGYWILFFGFLPFLYPIKGSTAVPGSPFLIALDSHAIQGTPDNVVADAGEIFNPAPADQDDGVLLQVVADSRNIRGDLLVVSQTNPGNLTKGGVGLFRRGGLHLEAHPAALGATLQSRRLPLFKRLLSAFADQLIDGWHLIPFV